MSYQKSMKKFGMKLNVTWFSFIYQTTDDATWNSVPKLSLVNSITPFIDRMIHEVDRLMKGDDTRRSETGDDISISQS